ncbi:MAG TPA: hypothetical protein VEK07_08680 [Polyangiaceae bacterium]|nr:hypothetical protein [Polyangiaceae bacterium]
MSSATDLSFWGLDAPLATFDAHGPCGPALLGARGVLLAAAWWSQATREAPGRQRWIAAVGAAFIASLEARGLLLPFALLSMFAMARSPRTLAIAAVTVVLCFLAAARPAPSPVIDDLLRADADPVALTRFWSMRDNAYRARFWAARWAAAEHDPGEGRLALARADWALGHVDEARRLAAQVVAGATDGAARQLASAQLAAWVDERR